MPHLFATGTEQLAKGAGYGDRPVLQKLFAGPALVRTVAEIVPSL